MADSVKLLEARVELLERDIKVLQVTLGQLQGKKIEAPAPMSPAEPAVPEDASEELLSWVNQSALLPQLATICFLLVVALMLRTVTDNDILDKQLGSLLGMTYAAALIGYGWYKYSRSSPLAPVFAICGAALMFTIVVETHAHFASLPSVPAYLLLMCTGAAMAGISYKFRIALPMLVGTLGMCIAAFAIDYPNPIFPYLVLLLLFANVLGFFATRLQRCSWLRWIILGLTVFTFQVWAVKLGLSLTRNIEPPAGQALPWFLPMVALLSAIYLAISLYGILKDNSGKISSFDFSLPTINVIWAFLAMRYVLTAQGENIILLGMFGAIVAAAYLCLAFWMGGRGLLGAPGTNTFALAGSVLLIMALPLAAAGYALAYLPLLAGAALLMAYLSAEWRSGGVRVTALLLQLYVGIALTMALHGHDSAVSFGYAPAAGIAALCALFQFHWCRKTPPPEESQVYSHFDKEDRSAVLLFMVSLVNGFLMLRVLLFLALAASAGDMTNAFACSQSVLINVSAAGLMLFAFFRRNKEIRNVAILVTLIGGGNVFLSDLFATRGFPLVASVFSFGLAVALESVILSRWQRWGNSAPERTT